MTDQVAEAARGTQAAMFLATEIALRLADVLVAKGVLTKSEARSTLYAIADGVRRDASGLPSEDVTGMPARTLEESADEIWPR